MTLKVGDVFIDDTPDPPLEYPSPEQRKEIIEKSARKGFIFDPVKQEFTYHPELDERRKQK